MAAPIVTWRDESDAVISAWDSGTVNAGEQSAAQIIRIWNNFEGADDVSAMQETKLSVINGTLDGGGDSPRDLLLQKWVEVTPVTEEGTGTPTALGIDVIEDPYTETTVELSIRGWASGTGDGLVYGWGTAGAHPELRDQNYSQISAAVTPTTNNPDTGLPTEAGVRNFKLRVSYYYV